MKTNHRRGACAHMIVLTAGAALAVVAVAMPGCAASDVDQASSGERDPLPARGQRGAEPADPFAKAAADLDQFYRDGSKPATASRPAPRPPTARAAAPLASTPRPSTPAATATPPSPSGSADDANGGLLANAIASFEAPPESVLSSPTEPVTAVHVARAEPRPAAPAAESPDARRARLINELAATLQKQAGASGRPMREALALTLLSGLDPAVTPGEAQRRLTPEQAEVLESMRALVAKVVGPEGVAGAPGAAGAPLADPRQLATALADAAEATAPMRMLNLPTVVLASRVEAFGRYTPLPGTTFIAGRPTAMVLYTEVEHFAARQGGEVTSLGELDAPATPEGTWTVWLAQSVDLFSTDGTRAWGRPEAAVRDTTRARRRDFFLTQRLELPANLSIGTYTLRVTVRDRLNGAQAEAIIPVTIVADPQMAALQHEWERKQPEGRKPRSAP